MKDEKERVTLRRVVWRGGKAGILGEKTMCVEAQRKGSMMCAVLPVIWFLRIMKQRS